MANIKIDSLSNTIQDILEEYSNDVTSNVKDITHDVSEKFKRNTKRDAPRGARMKFYRKINVKTTSETPTGVTDTWYVEDPEYRLTHLIANKHKIKRIKGGPVLGETKGNDFLEKNYKIAEKEFEERVTEVISNGH